MALLLAEGIRSGQPGRGNSARGRRLTGEFPGAITQASRPDQPGRATAQATHNPCVQSAARRREHRLGGPEKRAAVSSLQKRALEVELKIPQGTSALGKEPPQMLGGLEQRIGL